MAVPEALSRLPASHPLRLLIQRPRALHHLESGSTILRRRWRRRAYSDRRLLPRRFRRRGQGPLARRRGRGQRKGSTLLLLFRSGLGHAEPSLSNSRWTCSVSVRRRRRCRLAQSTGDCSWCGRRRRPTRSSTFPTLCSSTLPIRRPLQMGLPTTSVVA